MADQDPPIPNSNGADPPKPKSLREVAEAAYDELLDGADDNDEPDAGDDAGAQPAGQGAQPRDTRGRFTAREPGEPGEADGQPQVAPAPQEPPSAATPAQPAPVAGRSTEPPQHWSAEDREMFARQAPEAQAFLLRRHQDMERVVTQRTQAAGQAVEFVQALAPVYSDPAIAESLGRAGVSFVDAIGQWALFHRRAIDPDVNVRKALLQELAQRMQLDPAAVADSRPSIAGVQLTEEQLRDPAIRFVADTVSKSNQRVQALESTIERIQREGSERQRAEAQRFTRWGIDSFAEEKGADGQPLRPHFDAVLPQIIELFKANPTRDLNEAYQTALWMNPQVRTGLVTAERNSVSQAASNARAAQAVRSNLRGRSATVSKPAADAGQPKSLRQTLEDAADEVGIT